MKNGTAIGSLQGLDTPLSEGDVIAVFPFMERRIDSRAVDSGPAFACMCMS